MSPDSNMTKDGPVVVFQWAIYLPTCILGLPLNLAALWLMVFKIRRRTGPIVYLTNLVINDCLLIFSLPFKIHAYNHKWNLGRGFCAFLEGLVFVNIYGSIILTVCISADRFVSLQFPFQSKSLRSPRKAMLVCFIVWALVFSGTMPVSTFHKGNGNDTGVQQFCFQGFSDSTWTKVWIIIAIEVLFLLCTITMLFFSVRVTHILWKMRRRNPLDEKLRNNKSVKIVLSNLAAYLVCFIPYHVVAMIYFLAKNAEQPDEIIDPLRSVVHISTCVSSVNCLTDGICYYLTLKESLQSERIERERFSRRTNLQLPLGISNHPKPTDEWI